MVKKIVSFLCVVVVILLLQSHSLVQGKCVDGLDEPTASILRVFQLAVCFYLIK